MPEVRERIQAYMRQRKMTHAQMSAALGTPLGTMRSWFYDGTTPPAAVARLMDLLERDLRTRTRLGLVRGEKCPRGRPFTAPNEFSFGSPTREAALAEARKRKRKATKD